MENNKNINDDESDEYDKEYENINDYIKKSSVDIEKILDETELI